MHFIRHSNHWARCPNRTHRQQLAYDNIVRIATLDEKSVVHQSAQLKRGSRNGTLSVGKTKFTLQFERFNFQWTHLNLKYISWKSSMSLMAYTWKIVFVNWRYKLVLVDCCRCRSIDLRLCVCVCLHLPESVAFCVCLDWAIKMYDELIQNSRIRFRMASLLGRIIKWLRVTGTRKKSIKFIRRTKSVTIIVCVQRTRHTQSTFNNIEHPV